MTKRMLLTLIAAASLIGCSKDNDALKNYPESTPQESTYSPTPEFPSSSSQIATAPSTPERATLIFKVNELEKDLRDYGARFEVSKSRWDFKNWSDDREVISVKLVRSDVSDEELKSVGKNPEDRDALFVKMSELWPLVKANRFDDVSDDFELMTAVLKITVVRNQVMMPKFIKAFREAADLMAKDDVITLQKDSKFDLSLWNEGGESLTNAEAIAGIDNRLLKNQNLESLKVTFLIQFIAQLKKTHSINSSGTPELPSRITFLEGASEIQLLNNQEEQRYKDLKATLSAQPPQDKVDIKLLKASNRAMINERRAQLVSQIDNRVQMEMNTLEIKFTNVAGKIAIDQKSLTMAKVRGTYTGSVRSNYEVGNLQKNFKEFMERYGKLSDSAAGEADTMKKLDLFLKL